MNELTDDEVMTAPPREMSDAEVMTPEKPAEQSWWDRGAVRPTTLTGMGDFGKVGELAKASLKAFGHGFEEGFGAERLGMSEETVKALSKSGVFAPEGAKSYLDTGWRAPFYAMSEILAGAIEKSTMPGEAAFRTLNATYRGLQQIGLDAGLHRDVVSIPDAFMGSPHPMGIPKVAEIPRIRKILVDGGMDEKAAHKVANFDPAEPKGPKPTTEELGRAQAIMERARDEAVNGIDAYHGSPHDFEAFDLSKIGTGEGKQTYGHGAYFGENEKVGLSYRDQFFGGKAFDPNNPAHRASALVNELGSREKAITEARMRYERDPDPDHFNRDVLSRLESDRALPDVNANLYGVRLNVAREHLLDLDRPLTEQTSHVQEAVKRAFGIDYNGNFDAAKSERLWNEHKNATGDTVVRNGFISSDAARTSQLLKEAGIPGSQYLDEGSRSAKDGTRNFVIFDDKLIDITHKNGEPLDLKQAVDLGVVGEPRPPITEGKPADAAKRAVAADRAPDEKITQELEGTPNAWRERFDGFVAKLTTPEDAKALIRNAADENGEFQAARQGDIPLKQVEDLAAAAGVKASTIDRTGVGRLLQNDNQVRNAMQAMLTATENVKTAAREVKLDDSPANLMKLQEAMLRRDTWVEQVVGHRAEWGRTGNVFQEFLERVKNEESFNEFLKDQDRTPNGLKKIADMVDGLDGSQAARLLNDANKPTFWDKALWYWVNALISGPVTHAKYIVANAAFGAYESAVVTPVAGVIGTVRRAVTGNREGVFVGEAAARVWGLVAGTPAAIVAAYKAGRTGLQTALPGEVAQGIIPKQNRNIAYQQKPIPGAWGTVIGLPSRGASGIHSFFNFLGYRASMEAQAYRAAAKGPQAPIAPLAPPPVAPGFMRFYHGGDNPGSGGGRWVAENETYARNYRPGQSVHYVDVPQSWLDQKFPDKDLYSPEVAGAYRQPYPHFEAPEQFAKQMQPVDVPAPATASDSFWQRRAAAVDNPTVDMMNSAVEEGYRLTYITELGPGMKKLSELVNTVKPLRLIMPFVHIPFNVARRALEGTPLAFLDHETNAALAGKHGAVKQDMAAARLIAGGAVGAWAVNLFLNDRVSGFGPTERKERDQWLATGHIPYGVRIGDEWYSFNRFGSLGTMLGLYSNLAEIIPHMEGHDEDLTKAVAMVVHSTGRLLEDEVGMQGLAGLIEAINEPERKGSKFVASFAGSWLPYSSMQRQIASMMDPHMREAKTFVDGLRYYIPTTRQGLLVKRDWLGEPIANAGYGFDIPAAPGLSSIIQHRAVSQDPLAYEMKDLDLHPAAPQDRIGGVKLPPKMFDQYQSIAGAFTRQTLESIIAQDGWENVPKFARQEVFRNTIRSTRQAAAAVMQARNPELIRAGIEQRMDQIQGRKPTAKLQDARE